MNSKRCLWIVMKASLVWEYSCEASAETRRDASRGKHSDLRILPWLSSNQACLQVAVGDPCLHKTFYKLLLTWTLACRGAPAHKTFHNQEEAKIGSVAILEVIHIVQSRHSVVHLKIITETPNKQAAQVHVSRRYRSSFVRPHPSHDVPFSQSRLPRQEHYNALLKPISIFPF